ncbi:MAG: hypothetical protein FD123_3412 [Bacteroidetes bacterium]|nr:MAG: hypothetical protein FD123_3412 [Bacteroidota bacterium]
MFNGRYNKEFLKPLSVLAYTGLLIKTNTASKKLGIRNLEEGLKKVTAKACNEKIVSSYNYKCALT